MQILSYVICARLNGVYIDILYLVKNIWLCSFVYAGLHRKCNLDMSGSVARSQSSYNSFASSIQQDVILDVPNPLTSSCSVASFAFFDDKAQQATISDLDDDVGNTPLSEDLFKLVLVPLRYYGRIQNYLTFHLLQ